ncbi:MAG TPA: hypothetical protein VH374_06350 [Polyangia bacterium]|nr:hypothetical protein [Polyangia bacterium]
MILPPCVSIQLNVNQPSPTSAAIVEERCDAILGEARCEVTVGESPPAQEGVGCWTATVDAASDAPLTASVWLRDPAHPDRREVRRSVEFRQRDAPPDRWATMGLLIAALVTIEEHSATPLPDDAAERAKRERDAQRAAELLRASQPPPVTASRFVVDLRAAGLVATGMMPEVVWGLRAELAAGTRHLVGLARVSYLPSRTASAPTDVHEGADFRLVAPGLGGCWIASGATRLSARLCVGADFNISKVQGFGVSLPNGHTVEWGALWAGLGLQLRLFSHAFLAASLEGTAAIARPSFTLNSGDFYSIPPFGAYASLGLAVPY